jgi:peptidoglycan/LPS O-acetylase OafA/YrhL
VFFVLSGFYMSLIATRYPAAPDFYLSRFLRIMPSYWVCAIIAVLYYFIAHYAFGLDFNLSAFLEHWGEQPPTTQVWWLGSNLLLMGADWGYFLPSVGPAAFTAAYLIVPPAWSLGVEIIFYLACPLLLRLRWGWIALIAVTCLAWRVAAYAYGLDERPWHARFVGFELMFFCIGVLSHRLYVRFGPWIEQASGRPTRWASAFVMLAVLVLFYPIVKAFDWPAVYGLRDFVPTLLACALIAATLPGLFALSRNSKLDNAVGEYSYPVYLIHYPIVIALNHTDIIPNATLLGFAIIAALSMAHASLIYRFVQVPCDKLRHRLTLRVAPPLPNRTSQIQ